jgi:outer membrane lipoprotein-sorting protein
MHQFLKKAAIVFACFASVAGLCSPAAAYVLQGPHVLQLMAGNLGRARTLLVSQRLNLVNTPAQKDPVEFDETVRYVFPEKFRSDISAENVQRIHLVSDGDALTVMDGKLAADPETVFDRYTDLLLYRDRKTLVKRLLRLGVNAMVSSLGRYNGRPAYVVGAEYPDETVPQVWIDKETFMPFRWVLTVSNSESGPDILEARYLEWAKSDTVWYPMRVEFYRNDLLVREILVNSVVVNPSFSGDLFDAKHLRTIYPPAAAVPPGKNDTESMSEVQKTIEEFKKKYE